MNSFAEFEPQVRSSLNYHVQLMPANISHVQGIARLMAGWNQTKIESIAANLEKSFSEPEANQGCVQMFVALDDYAVVGYGKCQWLELSSMEGAFNMPDGWYLMGVIVDPLYRRQGIGRRLCEARLRWIKQQSNIAYYYVNALNEVSIRLHQHLGFQEVTRDFGFPGLAFSEGQSGILFKSTLQ